MLRNNYEWLKALPLLAVTGALVVMAIAALAGAGSPDARSREALFDYYQRVSPAAYDPDDAFHVVLIDRDSVNAIGPWPWPRTVLADLVEAIGEAGAEGIVLTEPVDAPDPLSPETIGAFWLEGASDDALARQLARLPSTDAKLAAAFAGREGAVAVSLTPPENPSSEASFLRTDISGAEWLRASDSAAEFISLPTARYLYGLNDDLAGAARPAVAALVADRDGLVRRLPLLWSLEGEPSPALAAQAALLANGADGVTIDVDPSATSSQGRIIRQVSFGEKTLRVNNATAIRLHLPRRLEAPSTSASSLLSGRSSNSQLNGKTVLIGLDTELGDAVRTARGQLAPVMLHTLAAAQATSGAAPKRPAWAGYLEALGVMVLGAAAVMIAQRMQFWQAAGFAAGVSAILLIGAFFIFANTRVLLDPLAPAAALFVGALSVAGGRSIGGALRDDSFRGAFHDTLPEPVMNQIREDGASGLLAGAYREITVLACELRLADDDLQMLEDRPDDVAKILAAASIDLRQTIIDAGGAADQADGGRIFAYFNAPANLSDHLQTGCAAALRLIESMDKINTDLEGSSATRSVQVHLAIGIATGPCFAGPMGHGRNNRYSAVGPAVDRAAFLRSQSEFYGPAMICDEPVYKETHHQFAYLELDRLRLRDSDRPFSIYALIGNPFIKSSKGFRDLDDAHRHLLAAYRKGDVNEAQSMLEKVRQSPGAKIALFDIYEERLRALTREGVPEGWDGVTSHKTQ
ncbi:MAG: adenylate/guanylate cyclase domain-containing protein [Pseudomonadota bacterium]